MTEKDASQVYGSYTGLVYLTPLLGGYIADQFWGNRRSIVFGGILMALGQFFMFLSASNYQNHTLALTYMWCGLGGLMLGNGFFKPNISSMVGQLYNKEDQKADTAFTIFYMGINFGALFSGIVCSTLGDTGNLSDFKWGFFAAFVGIILALIQFLALKNNLVTPDGKQVGVNPNKNSSKDAEVSNAKIPITAVFFWIAVILVLSLVFHFVLGSDWIGSLIYSVSIGIPGLIISDPSLTKVERQRVWVIFIVAFFFIFFIACFEQAGASLTFFADKQMNRTLNIHMSLGFVYLIVLGLASLLYALLNRNIEFPKSLINVFKVVGILLLGLAIKAFVTGDYFDLKELSAGAFNSANALFVIILTPLFAEIWGKLGKSKMEPASPYKQAIGLLFLSVGYLVIAIGVKDVGAVKVSMLWLISLYFLHTVGELCFSPVGLAMVSKLSPKRLGSLLMAVFFLAVATANKFAGVLSAYYPGDGKMTSFLGYHMANTYEFFMLFVVMAAVASLFMFIFAKTMLRLMNGVK